jgi:hypothetical protein
VKKPMMPPPDDDAWSSFEAQKDSRARPGHEGRRPQPTVVLCAVGQPDHGILDDRDGMPTILEYLQSMTGIFCRLSTSAPPVAAGSQ